MNSRNFTWRGLLFSVLIPFFTAFGIVWGIFTFYSSRGDAKAISDNLNSVGNTVERINQNLDETSTETVKVYPGNIDDIIQSIFDYCDGKDHVRALEIYTDVIGYAILTDNTRWNNYWDKITDLVNNSKNKKISLKWNYYDDTMREIITDRQFSRFKGENHIIELQNYLQDCKKNILLNCESCNYANGTCPHLKNAKECRLINEMKDYQTLIGNLAILQKETEGNLEALKRNKKNREIITKTWDKEFPFHAWFVIDDRGFQIRGIITFPTHAGASTEQGIYTKHREMLNVFYKIINDTNQE